MILKQLLGFLVTVGIILFVGSMAWWMLGGIFPALVWLEWVRLAAVGILVTVAGRLVADLRNQLDQMESKRDNAQLPPRPSE